MKRRRTILWVMLGCGVLFAVPCGFFGFWAAAAGGSSAGSPELAAEWRDHLAQFPTPDAAAAADPEVIVLRFPNGEWAFGRAQSSHGMWVRGGGTMVIRDSTGRTRAFFGHVCGWGHLSDFSSSLWNLEEYYEHLTKTGFTEHQLQ